MNLKYLTDRQLLTDIKFYVKNERASTTAILHHLKEVERRKLFSDLKYGSMMEYTMKELGYTEPAAGRRLQAARMLKERPEIENKLIDGDLSLTNLNKAAGFFKRENIKDPVQKKRF